MNDIEQPLVGLGRSKLGQTGIGKNQLAVRDNSLVRIVMCHSTVRPYETSVRNVECVRRSDTTKK